MTPPAREIYFFSDSKTSHGPTYCHTSTHGDPATEEEKSEDGDDVRGDLKQPADNSAW